MTEIPGIAETAKHPSAPERPTCEIPLHLTAALQTYFPLSEQTPLPERLAALVERVEAAVATAGGQLGDGFRDELMRALPALRTFALSLCANAARADDLVQETLVRAWANRDRFSPGTNFIAWTFTILRNQFYTEMRKSRREIEDAEGAHAATLTAAPDQEHAVALGSVMALISRLPLTQAQALLLVGAEGYTYEEAALRIGCQVGTVKSRVSRARAFLVANLAPGLLGPGLTGP